MVGPYYPSGIKPLKLTTSEDSIRSWPHGFGNQKLGANYGPTLKLQQKLQNENSQILWLFKEK